MITEKEKNELSKLNECEKDLYSDRVKKGVNRKKYDRFKEHAIHRKIEYALLMKVLHDEPIPEELITEFLQYYNDIEDVKAEAKAELS